MLVLSRKINQAIMIGDNIWLQIGQVKDGTVRIAIDAPKEIKIKRLEICEPKLREQLKEKLPRAFANAMGE